MKTGVEVVPCTRFCESGQTKNRQNPSSRLKATRSLILRLLSFFFQFSPTTFPMIFVRVIHCWVEVCTSTSRFFALLRTHLRTMQPELVADVSRHVPFNRHPHFVHHAPPLPLAEDGDVDASSRLRGRDAVQGRLHRADIVLVGQAPPVVSRGKKKAKKRRTYKPRRMRQVHQPLSVRSAPSYLQPRAVVS